MFIPGLCSVSFRNAGIDEIIEECVKNEIECIEWGGDVHVPIDDLENAKEVYKKTKESGIKILTFGSYYILGDGMDFNKTLKIAEILSAKIIRVWAGNKKRELVGQLEYNKLVDEAYKISEMAKKSGIMVALESHINTITEDPKNAINFINDVKSDNLYMYFQPNQFQTVEENVERARILSDKVVAAHMFNWSKNKRYSLSNGIIEWRKYLNEIKKENRDIPVFLEFIFNDSFDGLEEEVQAMSKIIAQ